MKKKWFAFLRLSCSVFYISQSLICGFSSRKYHFSPIIPFKCIVFKTYYLILSSFLFKNYLTILIFTVFQSGFHTVLVLFLFSISIPFSFSWSPVSFSAIWVRSRQQISLPHICSTFVTSCSFLSSL